MIVLWWEISPSCRSTAAYGQNWQFRGHHCWAEVREWAFAQTVGKINTSKTSWVIIGVLKLLISRMHESPVRCSCLLLIAHPNLPCVRKQTSTSDTLHNVHISCWCATKQPWRPTQSVLQNSRHINTKVKLGRTVSTQQNQENKALFIPTVLEILIPNFQSR